MEKEIKLNRLEARFLLNFVLEEDNLSAYQDDNLSVININNCKSKAVYKKKICLLKKKLQKLDKSFYLPHKT